ncbi:MAG TPA: inositol monophosphatase family protein [Candidatus Saccharimonadales bacterium]|jgi:fructose-1,6-bisphosphatase/inositol monophosphatase family enzyme
MLQLSDLNARAAWAEELARAAGEMMLASAHSDTLGIRLKLDKTQVTDADEAINAMVITKVAGQFPDDGVLGEEASAHADRERLWVCDPIDGTDLYILGLTGAMFSLALVEDGQPVAAVMYEPILDKMFTAVKGGGAFENRRPIHVSDVASLDGARVAFSPSYKRILPNRALYDAMVAAGVRLTPINGEAYRGGLTASGVIDGHAFPGRSAHDVAAVKLVVEEAGGKVTDLNGKDQRYDRKTYGAIISNGHVHDQLVGMLAKFGPENYIGY